MPGYLTAPIAVQRGGNIMNYMKDILNRLKERPGMYIYECKLENLYAFMNVTAVLLILSYCIFLETLYNYDKVSPFR